MDETPNQFRQTPPPPPPVVDGPTVIEHQTPAQRLLTPIAIGLGILLIVGGIFLGIKRQKKNDVAALPVYTPAFVTPENSVTDITDGGDGSPSVAASPSVSPVASPIPASSPSSQPAATKVATTTTRSSVTAKKSAVVTAPAQPTSKPASQPSTDLPDYQPVVALADYQPQFSSPSPTPQVAPVTIVTPTGRFTATINSSTTVEEAMRQASGLNFRTQSFSGLGDMIVELNGQSQTGNTFWTYQINGTFAQKGIGAQTVSNGDTITWTLVQS